MSAWLDASVQPTDASSGSMAHSLARKEPDGLISFSSRPCQIACMSNRVEARFNHHVESNHHVDTGRARPVVFLSYACPAQAD